MPGTDRWKPIIENPEAEETVPGVLIVRIRENLDFGMSFVSILIIKFCMLIFFVIANTSQLKGSSIQIFNKPSNQLI